jgi:hydroxymethylbilane synthase
VTFRLGTRGSRLALVQSESVAARLRSLGAKVEIVPIRTSGDRLAQVALAEFGGKALFVKEIEEALLAGDIDIAVHSLKDVPGVLPAGLTLGAFPPREDPRDVLVTRTGRDLDTLPDGSVVGTSSLRRRVLLLARRPGLVVEPIRGNVDTRLAKLDHGYDAVVLAKAGLDRLGMALPHAVPLSADEFVPAVGQGVLAVELRETDRERLEVLAQVDDTRTRMEAVVERSYLEALGAGCHTPVAGHARREGDTLTGTGIVASLDGRTVLRSTMRGPVSEAASLGASLARALLDRGAAALLGKAIG